MKNDKTNIQTIKSIFLSFAHINPKKMGLDLMVNHPFTDSRFNYIMNVEPVVKIDLLNKDDFSKWVAKVELLIKKTDNLLSLFLLISKNWRLVLFKYCFNSLSKKDAGEILSSIWITVENNSVYGEVTPKDIVRWFSSIDKKYLMSEEELNVFNGFSDKVTIYRGVTRINDKNKKAMSWTTSKKVAMWFSKRYDSDGVIWEKTVVKNNILCYLSGRGEYEVIVDPFKI